MDILPTDVLPLIIYNLPLLSIKNFIQTSKVYNNINWKNYFIHNLHDDVKYLYKDMDIDLEFMMTRGYYLLNVINPKFVKQHFNYYSDVLEMCVTASTYKKDEEIRILLLTDKKVLTMTIDKDGCFLLHGSGVETEITCGLFKKLEILLVTVLIKSIRLIYKEKISFTKIFNS